MHANVLVRFLFPAERAKGVRDLLFSWVWLDISIRQSHTTTDIEAFV
jgi:hypothetical protein